MKSRLRLKVCELRQGAEGLQVQSFVSWPLFLYFAVLSTLWMLRCGSSLAI